MGGMKRGLKIVGIVLAVLIIAGFGIFLWLTNAAKNELNSMVYENVDMNSVSDGKYYGETDAGLVFVRVRVTVKDHVIKTVEIIEHRNGMGSKAESVTERIIGENSYDVDAVSGATLSSEAIKSAVSKALKEGLGE